MPTYNMDKPRTVWLEAERPYDVPTLNMVPVTSRMERAGEILIEQLQRLDDSCDTDLIEARLHVAAALNQLDMALRALGMAEPPWEMRMVHPARSGNICVWHRWKKRS